MVKFVYCIVTYMIFTLIIAILAFNKVIYLNVIYEIFLSTTLFLLMLRLSSFKLRYKRIKSQLRSERSRFSNSVKGTKNMIFNMNYFDSITGLFNRNYLKEFIDEYIESRDEESLKAAFLLIDLDNFKYINDSFGHDFGDEVLMQISIELKNIAIEGRDILCRIGGDEFVMFMQDIDSAEEVEEMAQKIINIFNICDNTSDKNIYTTASVGVTIFPQDAKDFKAMFKNADVAMYNAKSNGKNSYQFFNDTLGIELKKHYDLEQGLRAAIENEELFVVLQPKVVLEDAKIIGFEALVRWNSDSLGFVSPSEFIPVAENTGLIVPIGLFVIEEVCKKCKGLIEKGYENFKIALNLSEIQLRNECIVNDFQEITKKYDICPAYIEIEITESLLMKSFDKNIAILVKLKELGFSVALDDFGTGYSSLNYLTKLPIDVLKIDRSFVNELGENAKSQFIVENIIQLSHKLGIKVVAEGVEEKRQVDYLKSIFCDFVQGYYFSKPESYDKILQYMEKGYLST